LLVVDKQFISISDRHYKVFAIRRHFHEYLDNQIELEPLVNRMQEMTGSREMRKSQEDVVTTL
jgi:sulfur relay (sulfurtransferase) DsrC/TusE family protein